MEKRDVRAGVKLQMHVGVAGQFDLARVDDNQLRAAQHRLLDPRADDGMVLRGIAAADEKARGLLNVIEGVRRRTGAKRLFHAGRSRRVADAGAAIHVVCAEHHAREFLREVVFLIRSPRRAEHSDAVRAMLGCG